MYFLQDLALFNYLCCRIFPERISAFEEMHLKSKKKIELPLRRETGKKREMRKLVQPRAADSHLIQFKVHHHLEKLF